MKHGRPRRLDLEREVAEFWDKNPDLTAQEVGDRFDLADETVANYYRRYWGEFFSARKRRSLASLRDETPQKQRSSQIRRGNDHEFVQRVAEFLHDHPEMTTDEVGEQFGISGRSAREYFIRFYKISLAPFRKRFQDKRDAEICDYIQKNPDATLYAIARQFGVSEGTVSRVSNALRSKLRRDQRKLDDAAAKEFIKENYVRSTEALARELGRTVPKVNALIGELQTEGFFVKIKRAETFAAYLKEHPDAPSRGSLYRVLAAALVYPRRRGVRPLGRTQRRLMKPPQITLEPGARPTGGLELRARRGKPKPACSGAIPGSNARALAR